MSETSSRPEQFLLLETDPQDGSSDSLLDSSQSQKQSSAGDDFQLEVLSNRFLEHLQRVRRCSPRTIEAYRADYRKLADRLRTARHTLDVREIKPDHIERCIAELSHLSAASVRRLLYAVRSFFRYLTRLDIVRSNPAENVPLPQKQHNIPECFSAAEVEALSDACQDIREAVIIGILRFCGLRRAELLSLDVGDISGDLNSLTVRGKGNKQRRIPIHSDLKELLSHHIENLPDDDEDALIRNTVGKRSSETSFYRLFNRVMERAGLGNTGLTPHSLRHHFGTALAHAGVDVATIAELMGHSNIQTTSVYLHSSAPSKRHAIEQLSSGPPEPGGGSGGPLSHGNPGGGDLVE